MSLPYTITAGTKAKASEVQGNDSNLDLRLVSVETMIENLTVDATTYGNGVFPDGLAASQVGTTLVYSTGGLICNHVYYNFTSSIQEFAGKAALTYYVECDSAGLIDIYATKSAARTNLNTVVWNGAGFDSVTEADRTVLATYQEIIDARGTYDTLEHRLDDLVVFDRGDAAAFDKATGDFTKDGSWYDWDVSAIVPVGARYVSLYIEIEDDIGGGAISFRKNGNANVKNIRKIATHNANMANYGEVRVPCDTNRVIEYKVDDGGTATVFTVLNAIVTGWEY